MPLKPVKRGFKVWVLADVVNGFISNLSVNTGKRVEKSKDSLESSVVKDLCKDIWHRYICK